MKKGIYFLITAILFLFVFATVHLVITASEDSEVEDSIKFRIQLMNDFLKDFENDAPRAMFVASFRAFIALEENVFETGQYYSDVEKEFSELFINGTINGTQKDIMVDSSMTDYLANVNSVSSSLGLILDFELVSVEISHQDPWNILVVINGTINLTDQRGVASWYYNTSIPSVVSIENLRDPVYTVEAQGKLPSPIIRWNSSLDFVDDSTNSTSNLKDFANGTFYVENTNAPSFLMRFTKNFSSSPYGIESIVNLDILGDQGISIVENKSVVDWIYFDDTSNTTNFCDIDGMILSPNWFVLDQDHLNFYEVDGFTMNPC